ncbi:MAG: transglutaminase-like domain-containing protein [Nakamurella sp.]
MTIDLADYSIAGPLTLLDPDRSYLFAELPTDPGGICRLVQNLVVEPRDAIDAGAGADREAERNIRSAQALIDVVTGLDPGPLHLPRTLDKRVLGTCRHFAVLSCALLRVRGIPARARCGFATYFVEGKNVDHWIVEHWSASELRWVRIDAEVVGRQVVDDAADLTADQFLTGGEAWLRYRAGTADPDLFGVAGVDFAWGIGEIRGNAIRDLVSLCKIEMLPWDEWGRMDDSYHGRTGGDYDSLMDRLAAANASDDAALIRSTYASEDLAVPEAMIV